MGIEQTNSHLDPAVGEISGYITGNDVKQAFIQTYTDLASKSDLSALVPDSLELTKTYVDAQDALKLDKTGGTMTGPLSLIEPVDPEEAATKQYVDAKGGGNRNWIVNADFAVNQRRATSVTSDGSYVHDQWSMARYYGTTTFSTQDAAFGDLPYNRTKFARLSVSGHTLDADGLLYLVQPIEDVRTLAGKTVTISFYAKGTPGNKIAVGGKQSFAGGSSSVFIPHKIACESLTSTWTRYSATIDIPSIVGKTLGAYVSYMSIYIVLSVEHWSAPVGSEIVGAQNGDFDIWGVQVEEGSTATPLQIKPYVENLRDCQRYYQRWNFDDGIVTGIQGQALTATTGLLSYQPPVEMAYKPYLQYSAVGDLSVLNATGARTSLTVLTVDAGSHKGAVRLNFTSATGLVGGYSTSLFFNSTAATGDYLALVADL